MRTIFKDETRISAQVVIGGIVNGITIFFKYWRKRNNQAICLCRRGHEEHRCRSSSSAALGVMAITWVSVWSSTSLSGTSCICWIGQHSSLPKKTWTCPPGTCGFEGLDIHSSSTIVSRVKVTWDVSPIAWGGHVMDFTEAISHERTKSASFILDVL